MINTLKNPRRGADQLFSSLGAQALIGLLFIIAMGAFELFNFDTTRFALSYFLGEVRFLGVSWAAILALAFCSIDFAGLARIFSPTGSQADARETWYLLGAWLLGATLNAIMTWWAVSLTLLNHELGNEVLGRETLLLVVPVFIATLVWLTRILFIGSLAVAADRMFVADTTRPAANRPVTASPRPANRIGRPQPVTGPTPPVTDDVPDFLRRSGGGPRPVTVVARPEIRPGRPERPAEQSRRAPMRASERRR